MIVAFPVVRRERDSTSSAKIPSARFFSGRLSKSSIPARPDGEDGIPPSQPLEDDMPDFLHTCIATMVAVRPNRNRFSSLGCGRDAVARLGVALALIAVLFGALSWEASGMGNHAEIAQVAIEQR
jgi:hypothetical protein